MRYILLIDTSGDNGLVALGRDGAVVSIRHSSDARNYAATLNLQVEEVLAEAGIALQDLSAIGVCGGPGSYTGLRIGLATAKGYCYVLDKPLMEHNRLLLLALPEYYKHLLKYEHYTTILPARDKEYFISSYDNQLNSTIAPCHAFEAETEELLAPLKGGHLLVAAPDAFLERISERLQIDVINTTHLSAGAWMRYAFEQFDCNSFVTLASAEPFYLKQVYTHKPRKIN